MPTLLGFHPVKALFAAVVAVYGFLRVLRPDSFDTVDWFNLAVHEGGHVVFGIFPEFIMVLGGSLMQAAMPAAITIYFYASAQYFSAAIALYWLAHNLFNISVYIGDARAQRLPLIFGDGAIHDWYYLLGRTGLLALDQVIGALVYGVGVLLYAAAIAAVFYFARPDAPWPPRRGPDDASPALPRGPVRTGRLP
jgi:hypothetical protein